jgi:hypothetical protein
MGLKAVLASKGEVEALAEPLRTLYVERDGKFVLDADVEEHPAVGGLRSALAKEREGRGTLDKELNKLRKDIDGLDPVKAREALARVQELEDKKLIDEGKFEELVAQRTKRLQDDHATQISEFQKNVKERESQLAKLTEELSTERIDNALVLHATKAGVRPGALPDVINRARRVWRLVDGVPTPTDGDKLIYGKDPSKPLPMEEWLDGLRKGDGAHLFEGSGGGGASNTATSNGRNVVLTREQAKDPSTYRAARQQADKQGGVVQIQEL